MKIKFLLIVLLVGIAITPTISQPAAVSATGGMAVMMAQPEVRLLEYNGEEYAADVKVGQNYIIQVINRTGGKIGWMKRYATGAYDKRLLNNEGIKLQRRISRKEWIEAKNEYAKLFDPDPAFNPKKGFIDPGKNTVRKWIPLEAGSYRIQFDYSTENGGSGGSVSMVTLNPISVTTVSTGFTNPVGILYDGGNIWVTDYFANSLRKLNSNGSIAQTITVGNTPRFPVFDGINI
jgi:hypothetical protein